MTRPPLMMPDILARIPHRPPFVLIDRVLEYGPARAVAIKNVTMGEPFFQGHFPGAPMMPGVLIGEAMAQTAAFIGGASAEDDNPEPAADGIGDRAFLTAIGLKLMHPVVPGDQLLLTAVLVKRLGKLMKIAASARVGQREVASADISVALV